MTENHRTHVSAGAAARFIATFLAIFAALQFAMIRSEGTVVERQLIDRATVGVAAKLVAVVFPQDGVRAEGYTIASSRARLNILRGCEGTELLFLVIAGSIAFPATWRRRMAALGIGLGLAYALNQLRIVGLYLTVRDWRDHFELVHAYLAPTLLIVAIALFFWWWAGSAARKVCP